MNYYSIFFLVTHILIISFGAGIGKGLGNHLVKCPLINTHILAADTLNLVSAYLRVKHFFDAVLVAAQHLAGTDFIISPQLFFAGCAFEYEHESHPV